MRWNDANVKNLCIQIQKYWLFIENIKPKITADHLKAQWTNTILESRLEDWNRMSQRVHWLNICHTCYLHTYLRCTNLIELNCSKCTSFNRVNRARNSYHCFHIFLIPTRHSSWFAHVIPANINKHLVRLLVFMETHSSFEQFDLRFTTFNLTP